MGNQYVGSKATAGLCQPLIALMPPHRVYLEIHLGGGAIMQRKPAALRHIGIDIDAQALAWVVGPVEVRCFRVARVKSIPPGGAGGECYRLSKGPL